MHVSRKKKHSKRTFSCSSRLAPFSIIKFRVKFSFLFSFFFFWKICTFSIVYIVLIDIFNQSYVLLSYCASNIFFFLFFISLILTFSLNSKSSFAKHESDRACRFATLDFLPSSMWYKKQVLKVSKQGKVKRFPENYKNDFFFHPSESFQLGTFHVEKSSVYYYQKIFASAVRLFRHWWMWKRSGNKSFIVRLVGLVVRETRSVIELWWTFWCDMTAVPLSASRTESLKRVNLHQW